LFENCRGTIVVRYCCEKLVVDAGVHFGNLEEAELPSLEPVTRKLVNTEQTERLKRIL
jgi:hypothetical protein